MDCLLLRSTRIRIIAMMTMSAMIRRTSQLKLPEPLALPFWLPASVVAGSAVPAESVVAGSAVPAASVVAGSAVLAASVVAGSAVLAASAVAGAVVPVASVVDGALVVAVG